MSKNISPYYGDRKVVVLQKARDQQVAELADVPGAVVHARVFSSDDPIALGWDRLRQVMSEEGMIMLRGVDEATLSIAQSELSNFEPKLPVWGLFMADAKAVRDVSGPIAESAYPKGVALMPEAD